MIEVIDLVVFFAFTIGIVFLGASFYHKETSVSDYIRGGGNIPSWVVGLSILSTYISSISYLGNPGMSYEHNWNPFVFDLAIPIAAWIACRYFVPFYRNQDSISTYGFLEKRFGRWARVYASFCYLLTQIARIGTIIFLLALPMNMLLGWNIITVIILTSIAIIFYAILGGIRGVIWTEAIQATIMIIGAFTCLIIIFFEMPEGPQQVFSIAISNHKFSLGSFSLTDFSTSTFWVCMIYGIFVNLQNFGVDQNYVQRYHTTNTLEEARRAVKQSTWTLIPVAGMFFLIGTSLYSYYQVHTNLLPSEGIKSDYVFPYFIVHQLPHGITGLLIASIFAAGMSTVATGITSSSTIVLTDYVKPLLPKAKEWHYLAILKISGLIIGLLGMCIAILMINVANILDAWWKLSSIFSGGMLGLFLLGFVSKRACNVDAAIGTICGILIIAWISAFEWLHLPNPHIHNYLTIVCGTATIFLIGFLACHLRIRFKNA
jgi:SSS family solute:Na+ symporter